jgi:maltose O-acetyltransferase
MSDQAPGPQGQRSQRDRMLAGELYIADDPQLAADNLRALTLTRKFNASNPADAQARRALLRELLGSVGEGTEIRPPLYCDYGYQTHVGARTSSTSDASCWTWPPSPSATTSRSVPTSSS